MTKQFRPTAIPLIANDPYFSVWSFCDRLTDDHPRHWTGRMQSMLGILSVDGVAYRFMGQTEATPTYFVDGPALKQTSVSVNPTSTVYTFAHETCKMKLTFLSPLLANRPEVLSRPVTYIFYEITPLEEGHTFEVYMDVSANLCGDDHGQDMVFQKEEGHVWMGNERQRVLSESGDDVRIDWGYLHLVHPNAKPGRKFNRYRFFKKRTTRLILDFDNTQAVPYAMLPLIYTTSQKLSDCIVVAYDDIHSVQYNHVPADAYYKSVYGDFASMLQIAVAEADSLREECAAFDSMLMDMMTRVSKSYANIGALAYRQTIAAHKLVQVDGKLMFFSKENFSNGCMATLDVTYPSIPLFLLLNPELVRGMMRPIFDFARSPAWIFPYAPHDCGRYPFCNGQVYSTDAGGRLLEGKQMPIEECGNAILCIAAAVRADGDRAIADENADLLKQWADYLLKYGYDPENQLCTDDFAGHLAHNCNLSVKAIVALGAYGQLFDAPAYSQAAKEMADRWVKDAKKENGKGFKLTFDLEDTWSLKYNIVWDRLLGLDLFDAKVCEEEVALYAERMQRYGVPLDSRADYTKLDWLAWTTVMTDNEAYTKAVYEAIERMICESPDRVPITDWYDTVDAREIGFQARSVLGGFYINLIKDLF